MIDCVNNNNSDRSSDYSDNDSEDENDHNNSDEDKGEDDDDDDDDVDGCFQPSERKWFRSSLRPSFHFAVVCLTDELRFISDKIKEPNLINKKYSIRLLKQFFSPPTDLWPPLDALDKQKNFTFFIWIMLLLALNLAEIL